MVIVRFENDSYDGKNDDYINKLVFFDQESGMIKVKKLERQMNTKTEYSQINVIIKSCFSNDKVRYRIIDLPPVEGSYSSPFKLYIDITDKCQLNCSHCLTKYLNKNNEIPISTIKEIAEECEKLGIMHVKLGGGEPTLHNNFEEILKIFSNAGCYISMSTNGYTIDDKMAKKLKEFNVKTTVSIEGNEEIDNKIRGHGHFEKAIEALKILKNNNVDAKLRVTLTREILDKDIVNEIISFADKYDTKVKFSYCRPSGSSIYNKMLINYNDYEKYFEIINILNSKENSKKVLLDEGMMLEQPNSLKSFIYRNKICGAANRSMHINSKLEISPCVFLGEEFKEEKNYKSGDIEKYWTQKKGNQFQRVRKISIAKACEDCKRLCKNECTATRLFFNKNINIADPNCLKRKKEDDDYER